MIHQQFTLEETFNFNQETTVTVYGAAGYEPACTPGQPSGNTLTSGLAFPFGTQSKKQMQESWKDGQL